MQINGLVTGICDPQDKIVDSYEELEKRVNAVKTLGSKVVLTSGSWDFKHIGHDRYLRLAREQGDFLVVGIESDERIRAKKGEYKPVVPQEERIESLAHLQYVNTAIIKNANDEKWHLIKTVQPDVLIISERTGYSEEDLSALKEFCGDIVVLESQAETSTSAKLRKIQIALLTKVRGKVELLLKDLQEMVS